MHPFFMRMLAYIEGTSDKAASDPYYKTIKILKEIDKDRVIARIDFEAAVAGGHSSSLMAQQFEIVRADIKATLQGRVDRYKIPGFNLPQMQTLGKTRDNIQGLNYSDTGHLDCYRLGDYLKAANLMGLKNLLARSALHGESEQILMIAHRLQALPDYTHIATQRPGKTRNMRYT